MASEKFCLRWNDFESNISVAFRELRDDKDFFDVTLACDDEQIQAHKVILSACSPFFRNVLRRNPHQHPLLYLKGVKFTDLQSVLNFMYHGEVNVAQEELNSFLAVAEDLRVKGLTQNQTQGSQNNSNKREASSNPSTTTRPPNHSYQTSQHTPQVPTPSVVREPPPKRPKPPTNTASYHDEDDDIQEVVPIKSEPQAPVAVPAPISYQQEAEQINSLAPYQEEEANYEDDYSQYEGVEGDQGYGDQGMQGMDPASKGHEFQDPSELYQFVGRVTQPDSPSSFECRVCRQFRAVRRGLVRNHVESQHFPGVFSYQCDLCQPTKQFQGRNALAVHNSTFHSTRPKIQN